MSACQSGLTVRWISSLCRNRAPYWNAGRWRAASSTTTKTVDQITASSSAASSSSTPTSSSPSSISPLRKKLKLSRPEKLSALYSPPRGIAPQQYDWFLVTDLLATVVFRAVFEAYVIPSQEILEIPVMKVNARTFEIESRFHQYVAPTRKPILTSYCTEQTGITQEMIEGKPKLPEALKIFDDWLIAEGLIAAGEKGQNEGAKASRKTCKWIFVTDGNHDLETILTNDAKETGITAPDYFSEWIDVNVALKEAYKRHAPSNLTLLLAALRIEHTGLLRGGSVDAELICRAMKTIAENSGYVFRATSKWVD